MDFNWKPKFCKKIENVEYKLFSTTSGLKIKKITKKSSKNSIKRSTVSLKIYKKTNAKQEVKITSTTNTKMILHKTKMKKINYTEEHDLATEMTKLTIGAEKRKIEESEINPGNMRKKRTI